MSDNEPIVVRFKHWLLDVSLFSDPIWVACTLDAQGYVQAVWSGITHVGVTPPPGGFAYGIWHPNGVEAVQLWQRSEYYATWLKAFEAARQAGQATVSPPDSASCVPEDAISTIESLSTEPSPASTPPTE